MKRVLMLLIRLYQKATPPWIHGHCRYQPTCSQYAIEALHIHGLAKGCLLAAWRILRCNPWGGYGCDPVPPKEDWRAPFRKKGRQ
ncbi:MAG: membrane protein insertion efficiency factor YidD [Oscillospiraceae bacterium]|nr:membrane protein insertion efficiency factor YidD [Oscillospiraceae bacterium]